MAKLRSAAYSEQRGTTSLAGAASDVFQQLGEASQRLMALQAQAAAVAMMDSSARVAEMMGGTLRHIGAFDWTAMPRSQLRSVTQPLEAWIEAATGLQAVLVAGYLEALALTAFPHARTAARPVEAERRVDSKVIQFPDRRRNSAA